MKPSPLPPLPRLPQHVPGVLIIVSLNALPVYLQANKLESVSGEKDLEKPLIVKVKKSGA